MQQERQQQTDARANPPGVAASLPERATAVVIGGGVVGCSIARELTRYTPDVVILEKECDVADATSKANNAMVHSGMGEKKGTLKARLNVRGNAMYEEFIEGLGVDFKREGMYIVITPRSLSYPWLDKVPGPIVRHWMRAYLPWVLIAYGRGKGLRGLKKVRGKKMLELEPQLNPNILAAIHDPNYGVISPYKLTIALAEHAIINGAKLFLDTEVTGIRVEEGRVQGVQTPRGEIKTSIVVNAAGCFADEVAAMAGCCDFKIHPRKGATVLIDKDLSGIVKHTVSELRVPLAGHSKGGGLMPTIDGPLQLGPTAIEVDDKYDTSVSAEEIDWIFDRFLYLLPGFDRKGVITVFTGVRAPTEQEDFVIGASGKVRGFVNAAGMQSPALASAPAIAELVLGYLHELGIPSSEREDFDPVRPAAPSFAKSSDEERKRLVAEDPRWGHVICRCEHVTEAEIVNAIHSIVPATTVDGIKRRTRAGMGRCQAGFCGPRVAAILARELGIPETEVTKDGAGSELFCAEAKGLLEVV
ncbi:MAG: FAD-dependent oxidoreductase [Candidatus Geothermincolia bacterium]